MADTPDVFKQLDRMQKRVRQEAVDLHRHLERELGGRAAQTLRIDEGTGRWAFSYAGEKYTGSTVGEVVQIASALRLGERRRPTEQLGFTLPMARGGSR